MTSNNFERMKIVLNMPEPFDYDKFLRICLNDGVQPLSINEYAMKIGYLEMAKIKYSNMPIEEAYLKIVNDANNQPPTEYKTCNDKPLPSLLAEVKNLASGVAHHAMDGFKNIDEKTLAFRITICDTCDNMRSDGRCAKCGCFMKIKAKWESAHCPENKWQEV